MLRPYLKIWDWDLIFGLAVKAPGVRGSNYENNEQKKNRESLEVRIGEKML